MRQLKSLLLITGLVVLWWVSSGSREFSDGNLALHSKSTIDSYEDARRIFWRELYPGEVTSFYCGESFAGVKGRPLNIEHVFPMSWVTKALRCGTRNQCRIAERFNVIESDLHNLFPTLTELNTARASFRFGMINGERREFGANCDFEVDNRQRVVEPRPEIRGDIARAMLYMQMRYAADGLRIFPRQLELLEQWNRLDPPDDHERWRNDKIERIQGNRNPYIDDYLGN